MSHCVSNLIGIRTGGVFSGPTDMKDLKAKISALIEDMDESAHPADLQRDPFQAMSHELSGTKGTYVVLAGVFNYWFFEHSSEFSRRLSEVCGVEVMHMSWDEEKDTVQCQVFLAGQPLFEVAENPIGRIVRRIV